MNRRLFSSRRAPRRAFTLVELLVVIAIISLLAAILFPVFAQAREKARQSSCQSNLKQFMNAIHQYMSDYDSSMPLCVQTKDGAGPSMIGVGGITEEFGMPILLGPYIRNRQIFQCPDDNGFAVYGTAKAANQTVPTGAKFCEAYGTSYKFNKDSFSILPGTMAKENYPKKYLNVKDNGSATTGDALTYTAGSVCLATSACTGGANPVFPLRETVFQRPTDTAVVSCYVKPWSKIDLTADDQGKPMHPYSAIYGFADGHAKTVVSKQQAESYCDGPTWSPIRNKTQPGYDPKGDGSCSGGAERNK